jgi:hypothetical protein
MLKKPKSNLDEVLAELREEHRAVKAPAGLESHLSAEAARRATAWRRAPLRQIWGAGLGAALLALALLGAAEWRMHRARSTNEAHAPVAPRDDSHPVPIQEGTATKESAELPTQKRAAGSTSVRHSHLPAENRDSIDREESLADFIPLPASEGLPPAFALSLVRMQIKQSSLQQYGLEVPADSASRTLLAEFAVGEDGLPRAIRIIP